MRATAAFFALLTLLAGCAEDRRSHLPAEFGETTVLFAEEQSWGAPLLRLPGDNETGFIVYELPPKTADLIRTKGLAFLEPLRQQNSPERPLIWTPTPLAKKQRGSASWFRDIDGDYAEPDVRRYLGRYGFHIELPSARVRELNEIIRAPGAYYAYGRVGVLIVAPNQRLAYFLYAG